MNIVEPEGIVKKILLDFDGTVVEHEYPKIGRFVPEALRVVQRLRDAGHKIILNTYRADIGDGSLQRAKDYLEFNQFVLRDEVESIIPDLCMGKKLIPESWLNVTADSEVIFIDDQAYGIPLIPNKMVQGNMVDWLKVESKLEELGILSKTIKNANESATKEKIQEGQC